MVDGDKHEMVCDIEEGVIVNGDRNRLKQALREFLQNAIKYTPPMGQIKITLKKEKENAIINVIDTGMGISKKDMGHIFTRFYRGDVSRNRDKGGYGLGLAICREIIAAHKGKITFKSKEGAGTSVLITLSLQ
jgi:signal transduction histidine kinase